MERFPGRRLRAALVSAIVGVVVAACAMAPASSPPPVTLVLWVDNPAIGASVQQRIVPFMHDYPNIQVKVFDQFGRIRNGDVSTAIEALANSELSPDVVALTNQDFGLMSNRGDLVDLRPYIQQETDFQEDDFFPTTMAAFQDRGKQLAIPSELVPWVVFYNQTLFDRAKIPYPGLSWTASDFIGDAKRIMQSEPTNQQRQPQLAGFVTDPTVAILPVIAGFGVEPHNAADDPDARWLSDPRAAQALQWFADLGLREGVMPTDPANRTMGLWYAGRAGMMAAFMDQRDLLPAFFQRRLGIQVTPTVTGTPAPQAHWSFRWGVTMMPRLETQTTVYYLSGYGIPATSRNPQDAWTLIDYLTRHLPETPGRAYVPARESLAYSKQFAELYPETGHEAYVRSIELGRPIPVWPPSAYPTYDDLAGALNGTVHPSTALSALRDRVQPILAAPPPPTPTPVGG
ncbi:MAG TPA: extracellular solute-binding protein [Chloroflexota bacterium]|nr:extracellular solute-binding protein [Chloroflexota bacterium]